VNRLVGMVWVARHCSYAKAARAFPYPITQPGLFQQVRRLEEELGFDLFIRTAKDRVELTTAGRSLFERVSPFFDELEELVDVLQSGKGGVLRLEASALVLRQLMPDWLRKLRVSEAELEIRVTETDRPDLSRLSTGKADVIVDFLPSTLPKGVSSKVVAVAYGYLVVPSRRARKKRMALADMGDTEFIAYPSWTQHREIQNQALSDAGVQPRRVTEVGTADSMVSLVAAGLGYTLVPWLHKDGPTVRGTWAFKQERLDASFPIQCAWNEAASRDPMLMNALAAAPSL
jgi:DNA-binding transcriptional LysR family regulator